MKVKTFVRGKCNTTFAIRKPREHAERLICPDSIGLFLLACKTAEKYMLRLTPADSTNGRIQTARGKDCEMTERVYVSTHGFVYNTRSDDDDIAYVPADIADEHKRQRDRLKGALRGVLAALSNSTDELADAVGAAAQAIAECEGADE